MPTLSKACKSDNFELQNSLKFSFPNIRGLHSNFGDCESFLELNSPDILALCETNLDVSIFSDNFFEMLSSFNPEGFQYSYAWSPSLCEGRTSFCTELISKKLCRFNYLCFPPALLHSVSYFFFNHFPRLCARFLILFHLTQMRFSQSTHLQMCLFLETLTSIIRTGLPILVELTDLVNFSDDLTQMIKFPTWIPDCDSDSPSLLDLFSSDASICFTMAFPALRKFTDHVIVSVFH